GKQHHVDRVGRGSHHRGDDENNQYGVTAVPDQKSRGDQPEQGQKENQHGKLKNQAHPKHHVNEQIEVFVHRNDRRDALVAVDAQQKRDGEAKRHEIRKQAAQDEQTGRAEDERDRKAPLAPVKAGGSKRPNLVEKPRRREKNSAYDRQLEPDHIEGFQGRDLGKIWRIDSEHEQCMLGGLADELPKLVAK